MSNFIARARSLMQRHASTSVEAVLGISPQMRQIENILRRVADLTTPLLVTGETGAGKEVCARYLHGISIRSREPFIAVSCSAIPPDFMERELFGYRGASGQGFHHGFAERARGGILFFDEVSELPMALQAKLLRLVEEREYRRVGGEQLMHFHGRIVCSSNRSLDDLIGQNKFRTDLLYRINSVTVDVPPLRQRHEDIPWLIEHYLEHFKKEDEVGPRGVSSIAHEAALEHAWPGNARELRNRMERAVALTKTEWIMPSDLFPDRAASFARETQQFATLSEARDFAEKRQIERALRQTNGQIIEAAKLLRISRTTLWEKMRRLGLSSDQA
jgi:DNA-binding NtrC family response regulator